MNDTITISTVAEEIASSLLQIKAVKLQPDNPFTWSSGWKSPIYCDNRITLSYPALRTTIKQYLANAVRENFKDVDVIAGVATAGIPQGALVADVLNLPYVYVRSKPKSHGMTNQIEGHLEKGSKVVLVEDLISTGGSSLKAAEAITEAGATAVAIVAIFTYGFPEAEQNFKEKGVKGFALSNYQFLLKEALRENIIGEKQLKTLQKWREDPAAWRK